MEEKQDETEGEGQKRDEKGGGVLGVHLFYGCEHMRMVMREFFVSCGWGWKFGYVQVVCE